MPREGGRRADQSGAAVQLEAVRDVLRAISRAPFDVDALLDTVCEHAVQLCRADFGYVFVPEGDHLRLAGSARAPAEMRPHVLEHPPGIDRRTGTGRAMLTGCEAQISRPLEAFLVNALAEASSGSPTG